MNSQRPDRGQRGSSSELPAPRCYTTPLVLSCGAGGEQKNKSTFFGFHDLQAPSLLKRQISRLQFLHRNVKLDVLNGAGPSPPAGVFGA